MDSCFYVILLLFISSASARHLEKRQHLEPRHFPVGETTQDKEDDVVTHLYDGFIVMLDYDNNLLIIKNSTSDTCFFSHLENDPLMKDNTETFPDEDDRRNDLVDPSLENFESTVFSATEKIPVYFKILTSDATVEEQCEGLLSFWLVADGDPERPDVRAAADECCCCECKKNQCCCCKCEN